MCLPAGATSLYFKQEPNRMYGGTCEKPAENGDFWGLFSAPFPPQATLQPEQPSA